MSSQSTSSRMLVQRTTGEPDGERAHESPPATGSSLRGAPAQSILHPSMLGWGSSALVQRRFVPITTSWAN